MNLVLYSGGDARTNRSLARETLKLLERHEAPLITFIPSDGEDEEKDFAAFKRQFRSRRLRFHCLNIEDELSPRQVRELFSSQAIFLGGGNTYYFLRNLRARGLLARLRRFVKQGGVLMGLSAGSILLTPSIRTAAVPSKDADENDVRLRNLSALGLVPFEFSPHYLPSKGVDEELKAYSKRLDHPVYACRDGSGLVVRDGKVSFVGSVSVFHGGRKLRQLRRIPRH